MWLRKKNSHVSCTWYKSLMLRHLLSSLYSISHFCWIFFTFDNSANIASVFSFFLINGTFSFFSWQIQQSQCFLCTASWKQNINDIYCNWDGTFLYFKVTYSRLRNKLRPYTYQFWIFSRPYSLIKRPYIHLLNLL